MSAGEILKKYYTGTQARVMKLTSDSGPDQLVERPGNLAPILWQVGHIAISEAGVMGSLGHKINYDKDIAKTFSNGTNGEGPFPEKEEVFKYFEEIQKEMMSLCEEDLTAPLNGANKYFGENWGEVLTFMHGHRNYHIGKISSLITLTKKA